MPSYLTPPDPSFSSIDAVLVTVLTLITVVLIMGLIIFWRYTEKRHEVLKVEEQVKPLPQLVSVDHAARIDPGSITILIPTLNEEAAIGKVIQEVKSRGYENILVVDGYSQDKTVEIARENGAEVVYQIGVGKADAIRTGLAKVTTPYVLVMDGDGTYDPSDIERLLRVAVEYGFDEVIGYRVRREHIPLLNRIGNRLISSFLTVLMGHRVRDPCSGMYLLRTDMVRNLEITAAGFDIEAEIVAQMLALGRVAEIPINYRRRIGRSKLSSFRAGLRIIWTAYKLGWLYNPVFMFSMAASLFGVAGLLILAWQLSIRYLYGAEAWSLGWALFGLTLLVIGLQATAVAVISLLLKRMERRVIQLFRKPS
ncbi:MAG: glycosyltransferase [Thaumarchaeota archaeon]|nr:glycosyltransferase [Nitrososphaerota archaeon]